MIFSENYTFSTGCLRELSEILECTKNRKRRVMPVFYKIDPSQVKNQSGSYGIAISKHQHNQQGKEVVRKWRENLTFAANFGGWDSRVYRYVPNY